MLKVGIAGAGTIVPDFLEAAEALGKMKLQAICATPRSVDKLKKIAEEHHIAKIYTDYEEMLLDQSIDVIYVAVPNSLHYGMTKKALEAGMHVILEKPFASNLTETDSLIALAKQRGRYLFEAVTNQYYPNYDKLKELLPRLGAIKIAELNFSQYSRRYDAFKKGEILPVFDVKKSGGALMDINVYNIHFVTGLFGRPKSVTYYANMERGIDTSGILVLAYDGFCCSLTGAKDCKAPLCVNIQGDEGYVNAREASSIFDHFTFERYDGEKEVYDLNEEKPRLFHELRMFVREAEAENAKFFETRLRHSRLVMEILDEARKQAGIEIQGMRSDDTEELSPWEA